jgi:hypothetical protein
MRATYKQQRLGRLRRAVEAMEVDLAEARKARTEAEQALERAGGRS